MKSVIQKGIVQGREGRSAMTFFVSLEISGGNEIECCLLGEVALWPYFGSEWMEKGETHFWANCLEKDALEHVFSLYEGQTCSFFEPLALEGAVYTLPGIEYRCFFRDYELLFLAYPDPLEEIRRFHEEANLVL